MPYMQMNLIKKHGAIYLFLLFLIHIPMRDLESSPWATPDDVLVKHDLQILSDAGVLNIPINTWPIAWGDVAYNLKIDNPENPGSRDTSFTAKNKTKIDRRTNGRHIS